MSSASPFEKLADLEPVSLEELDARASLQRRVDNKYIVTFDRLDWLLEELRSDHDVLEIEGDCTFDYRSVYFETPGFRCFFDHVRDVRPRFKVRTRNYVTTNHCVFEVKIKQEDGRTVKESIDYEGAAADRMTDDARELVAKTLGDVGLEPPSDLQPTLVTQFRRSTLALHEGGERLTIDRELRLVHGDDALRLRDDRALLESKTEDGEGRADRALADAGVESVSLSKYRLGIGRLACPGADPGYAEDLLPAFERERVRSSA